MRLVKKLLVVSTLLWSMLFMSCDAINPTSDGDLTDYTCEGCQTNRNALSHVIEALDLEPHEEAAEAPG